MYGRFIIIWILFYKIDQKYIHKNNVIEIYLMDLKLTDTLTVTVCLLSVLLCDYYILDAQCNNQASRILIYLSSINQNYVHSKLYRYPLYSFRKR